MKINSSRLQSHFETMSLIGKIGETGTCRPAHTQLEKKGFELAASWMVAAGMKTHIDNFGNLIGRLEGKNPELPVLMMGSHLDSQPYGGRFDGVAGVLCAIEVVKTLSENQIVAFIVSVFLCFFFYFVFDGLVIYLSFLDNFISSLGMENHFKSMSRGVLDTRDIIYFVSLTIAFLSITVFKLKSLKF